MTTLTPSLFFNSKNTLTIKSSPNPNPSYAAPLTSSASPVRLAGSPATPHLLVDCRPSPPVRHLAATPTPSFRLNQIAADRSQASTMEDDPNSAGRRSSSRTRKVASKMVAALASADNRNQAALARLEALENDNAAAEAIEVVDDDEASLDDDDQVYVQKKQSSNMKRKTRQGKARENAKKGPRTFLELLQEADLESLLPHVPSYLRAAVGPPSSTSRRNFCTVCGYSANYTCVRCGVRFCCIRCQNVHNDTRCLKFVA